MRGVQSASPKNVEGLKAHLSMPQRALNFDLLPAVLRRAVVRRSRTMRTARVPWLVPTHLTPRCGPPGERPHEAFFCLCRVPSGPSLLFYDLQLDFGPSGRWSNRTGVKRRSRKI